MLTTSAFLFAMIPLYFMVLIGFVSRRIRILNKYANQVLTQLMLYITLPALILYSLHTSFSVHIFTDFVWLVLMSVFILCVSVLFAALLRRIATLPSQQKPVYESLIIFGNQGYLGFAISYILLGDKGIVYVTFFNICYFILIWTYGIYLFTKNEKSVSWKGLFFNPGILSTIIGLIMLFLPYKWPAPALDLFESVGKMTVPLSMILIGSMLAELKWNDLRKYSKNIYIWVAASSKLVILPLFLFVFLFFNVPFPLITIAVLTSAMPSASTTSIYAQRFEGDAAFGSIAVVLTTILCIFTIPLLYTLLQTLHPLFY